MNEEQNILKNKEVTIPSDFMDGIKLLNLPNLEAWGTDYNKLVELDIKKRIK